MSYLLFFQWIEVLNLAINNFDRIGLYEQVGWNHNSHYHSFLLKQLPSQCQSVLNTIGCGTGEFYYIRGVETVPLLLELLRMNYDRLTKRRNPNSLEGEAA